MGFLEDVNLNDVVEPRTVSGGEEYRLRILDVKRDDQDNNRLPTDKNGYRYLMPIFEIPDEIGARNFNHYIRLPSDDMSSKEKNDAKYRIKQFLECFDFDPDNPPELDGIGGAEGYAILGERSDPEYGDQNTIRRFVPRR